MDTTLMDMTAEALLKQHGLRKTSIRIEILDLFRQQPHALSASDLERTLTHYDRVTVYRTLNAFEASGLIHQVPDEGYGVKYALCSPSCPDQTHDDEHVHFICQRCRHTFCLEEVHIPTVELPGEYAIQGFRYTVSGVCKECNIK